MSFQRAFIIGQALAAFALGSSAALQAALGEPSQVVFSAENNVFPLVKDGEAAAVLADSNDWPGVVRVIRDFQADVKRVTGVLPRVGSTVGAAANLVVIGTLGRSDPIDRLAKNGRIDVEAIRGRWESWIMQVVTSPFPGVDRALIIAGSDKRGTIYGTYALSEQIGVSPWHWWADLAPVPRAAIFVKPDRVVHGSPAVRYRGIFLNDEAPCLTSWVRKTYGAASIRSDPPVPEGVANYGREFYARIFEVLLRLRGNYLWPAMWNNAFNEDDPENARLADEYGVVMGTSHQEPMLRAQKEWERRYQHSVGKWNYARHPDLLANFWREGVRRNRPFESIVTLGLRGANDTEMAPGGPEANRAMLERIVAEQRRIIADEMDPDVTRVPQLWCLYKEVQQYYEHGMRVPDDVTLLWADDNWGNLRRLPTPAERSRPGGAGIYYHFDYVGGPRSYRWIDTNPLPKIWEQMSLATRCGADRIWIVNVGDFKGLERPTEFFLNLAWNPSRWTHDNIGDFTGLWAEREFGASCASEIADIVSRTAKYNGRRKPEMLSPATYSLIDYREGETVVADFETLAQRAETLFSAVPAARRDAFYQLVLFPARASAIVNALYLAAGKNALHACQGRASTAEMAARTRALFAQDLALMKFYNTEFAGGKWAHFMDEPHLGYTSWNTPSENSLRHLTLVEPKVSRAAALGVAIEGSAAAWPESSAAARLPPFDALNRQSRFIEVFNRGAAPFEAVLTTPEPWIVLPETKLTIGPDRRVEVTIDWKNAPLGPANGTVRIAGAGTVVSVQVEALNPVDVAAVHGFVEDAGVVSIEPEHASRTRASGGNRWVRIADYGRTLSGLRAEGPLDAAPATPGRDSACLEYDMHLFAGGSLEVIATTAPTLNFLPQQPLRYAVSIDDAPPQIVTLVPVSYEAKNRNGAWEKSVGDNAHFGHSQHGAVAAGQHTLKMWMIDPGVVLQKIVVHRGELKPSYLGPPESLRRSKRSSTSSSAPTPPFANDSSS